MFSSGYMGYMIVTAILGGLSGLVGMMLKKKINKYINIPMKANLSGQLVAKQMLDHYGIHDVQIIQGQGTLTDHYNPQSKTVSLSPAIFNGTSIAAAAVAAHECGHAVQHAESYAALQMRSAIVPLVQFSASAQQFILMGAFMGMGLGEAIGGYILLAAIAVFGITALFSIVTLPVEFDASARALKWLDSSGVAQPGEEYDGAKDALKWAAMTYVAAALSAIVMVLYFVMKYAAATNRN